LVLILERRKKGMRKGDRSRKKRKWSDIINCNNIVVSQERWATTSHQL